MGTWWSIIRVTLVLVAIVVLLPRIMRRVAPATMSPTQGRRLRVVDSVSCGGSRLVCMVKYDERELVLGVTDSQITLLSAGESALDPLGNEPPAVAASFLDQLKGMVCRPTEEDA